MDEIERPWLNVAEAAQYTGRGQSTVRYAAQAGELHGTQQVERGRWSFTRADLDAWMRGEKAQASA